MRAAIWDAYLHVQSTMAYGMDVATGYCDVGLALAQQELTAMQVTGPTLVVGGGHPRELEHLVASGLAPLVLLTAHQREADACRDRGLDSHHGDIHDMPFPSGSMAGVFQSNVMEHVFAPYIALMECRRVTRLGGFGYFAIPEFEGPEHGPGEFHLHCLTDPVWRQLLAKTGWQVERVPRAIKGDGHCYSHYICTARAVPFPHSGALERIETARMQLAQEGT